MRDQGFTGRQEDKNHERRKIIVRVAIAAALIVALLATLLFIQQPKDAPETEAMPALSKPQIGVAISSSSNPLPDDIQTAIKNAPDTAQAALASMSAPVVVEPATSAPVVPEGSMDPSVKPILGAAPVAASPAPRTGKESHHDRVLVETPKVVPPVTPAPVPPLAVAPPAVPANTNFVVQLGVFNNIANAEELRTKLKLAGIPSQLETRVQVGPFASKEEAVKAQDKLRKLGLGNGMLVPAKKP